MRLHTLPAQSGQANRLITAQRLDPALSERTDRQGRDGLFESRISSCLVQRDQATAISPRQDAPFRPLCIF